MANSIALTVYSDENGVRYTTPITKYYVANQIMSFAADTITGITGVNARVTLKYPKGNGNFTPEILVGTTAANIQTALAFISLTVYRGINGGTPTGGSQVRYYNASLFKSFATLSAASQALVPGAVTGVYIQFPKGNGNESGSLLVSETATAIATALG